MFSLWNRNQKHKIVKKKPSPTLKFILQKVRPARSLLLSMSIKRIPLPASLFGASGSMTLEAAVILPLFLFFFLNLMSAVEMLRLHGNLELALWENGRLLAVGGYVYDKLSETESDNLILRIGGTLMTDRAVQGAVYSSLGEDYLNRSPLTYGADGINFLESSYMEEDCIDIKVTYQVSPFFSVPGFGSFRMANRYYARAWTGYQIEEEAEGKERIVYVTQYGEVYHFSLECSYLKRIIQTAYLEEALSLRNRDGESYTMCRLCENQSFQGKVYLTPEGNRYHYSLACPALKRVIRAMELSQAKQQYRECSRCGD